MAQPDRLPTASPVRATLAILRGRPTLHVDGRPLALAAFSPAVRTFEQTTPRFFPHKLDAYFLNMPRVRGDDFHANPFWDGDRIGELDAERSSHSFDEQAAFILAGDPDTHLLVRFGPHEPRTWRDLHRDELFVNERGEVQATPSLASQRYWLDAARFIKTVIRHCEQRPWGGRIVGYWPGMRVEGSHQPMIDGWLFDHGPRMTERWRAFLKDRYGGDAALREAWGDQRVSLDTVAVPRDRLRGPVSEVSELRYWQAAKDNQPLRDYLALTAALFHAGFRRLAAAAAEALDELGRQRVVVWDALKQVMQGWHNMGFFDPQTSWPLAYAELMAGSGHLGVADLLETPGCDGLITPHDYQARGVGGVYEPEGAADTCALRGKLLLAEMDTRTWTGRDPIAPARDIGQFEAITWRNLAAGLTRGFVSYWMDVYEDWFADPAMHEVIARQRRVLRESLDWEHATVPGIAMIIDDRAVLETNGDGRYLNEAIMWEQKSGLARCGVPFRMYLLDDLARDDFPDHRVFYFPNLFRVDDQRLALLREKVFGGGRAVLWGPGSGISDGRTIGTQHAERLTGFAFDLLDCNAPRRALPCDFEHPITADLDEGQVLGGPLAYGPVLLPRDGRRLAHAWTKQNRDAAGLSVKPFGRGAGPAAERGPGDWDSVFSTFVPIPAHLWRGLGRHAGAHVYSDTNDVLLADRSLVAVHGLRSGPRTLRWPDRCDVVDLFTGDVLASDAEAFEWHLEASATRLFHLRRQS